VLCCAVCCTFDVLLLIYGVERGAEQTTAHFTDKVAQQELVPLVGSITNVEVAR